MGSGWFDRALTTAQRDAVLGFANPSHMKIYNITIKYSRNEGEAILDSMGAKEAKDERRRLAEVFTTFLDAAVPRGSSF